MEKSFVVGRFWQSKVGVNINSHAELDSASAPLLIAKGQGEILKQVQDDGRSWFGLHAGFTLIELLVVVLIISILAAIALPQYNKAVIRSRFATLKDLTKSIATAEEIYYLTNGAYATRFDELDLDVGGTPKNESDSRRDFDWGYCWMGNDVVWCWSDKAHMRYIIYLTHTTSANRGKTNCQPDGSQAEHPLQHQICQQETGSTTYRGTYRYEYIK